MMIHSTAEVKDRNKDNQAQATDWISDEEYRSSQRNNELLLALNKKFDSVQTRHH